MSEILLEYAVCSSLTVVEY